MICYPDSTIGIQSNLDIDCGYSNALQFDVESKTSLNSSNYSSKIWFTEQSENKIGYVDLEKTVPISLAARPNPINITGEISGETVRIEVQANIMILKDNDRVMRSNFTDEDSITLKPVISSTFTPNGDINGLEATVKPDILHVDLNQNFTNSDSKTISFNILLKTVKEIPSGNYNLMVGLESKDFTIMKKVKLNVIN